MKSRYLLVDNFSKPVDNLWITLQTSWTKWVDLFDGKISTFKVSHLPFNGGGYIKPPSTDGGYRQW